MEFHGPRTQIFKEIIATNETLVVYTVPTGKKFYLVESMLVMDAGATGEGYVEVRSPTNVHIRHINHVDVRENNKGVIPGDHFEPGWPVELTVGENIAVVSDSASLAAECDVFGFEVDA